MRHANAKALAPGERGGKLTYIEGVPENVLAFTRKNGKQTVHVFANLGTEPAEVLLPTGFRDAMSGEPVRNGSCVLAPWGFVILSR